MADPEDPARPPGFVERRRRPRVPGDRVSWEQVALRRVAGRVKALPAPGADAEAEAEADDDDFGWERAVLERLRRRLDEG